MGKHKEEIITVCIANFIIKIVYHKTEMYPLYSVIQRNHFFFLKNFIVKKSTHIDFTIHVYDNQNYSLIERSAEKKTIGYINLYYRTGEKRIATYYAIGNLHFQFLLRMILNELLMSNNGFLLHSSASRYDRNSCLIFTGPENAGKSTIASLIAHKHTVLTDDISIIRMHKGDFFFYQSPFIEKWKYRRKNNKSYKIGNVFFLKKASVCKKVEIPRFERKLRLVANQILSDMKNPKVIETVSEFVIRSNIYYLYFPKNADEIVSILS